MSINSNIPDYLINRNNTVLYLIFVMFFSILFVNVFTPFKGAWYNTGDVTSSQLLLYSVIIVLGGIVVMAVSRFILGLIRKRNPITVIQFLAWMVLEIFVIAILYSVICRYGLKDMRPVSVIFGRALVFIPLILIIPTIITYLYVTLHEREQTIARLLPNLNGRGENNADSPTEMSEIVNFKDDKGELKLSVKVDYIYLIEASENYVFIYYDDKGKVVKFLLRSSMKRQEERLSSCGFVRCHRSYMVNFSKVVLMRKDKDGPYLDLGHTDIKEIPVSKTYLNQVTALFSRSM